MPIPEITRGSPEWLHVPRQGVACCGKDDDGPSHDKHNLLDGVRPLAHQLCAWRLMMEKSKENLRTCLVWLVAFCTTAPCKPLTRCYVKDILSSTIPCRKILNDEALSITKWRIWGLYKEATVIQGGHVLCCLWSWWPYRTFLQTLKLTNGHVVWKWFWPCPQFKGESPGLY